MIVAPHSREFAKVTLRRVGPDGVEPLLAIMEECGRVMADRYGLRHWMPPITLADLRAAAATREVWEIHRVPLSGSDDETAEISAASLVGAVITGTTPPAPYLLPTMFAFPASEALYISKLAILPSLQGEGIGSAALARIEALARSRGVPTLRLDALRAVPNLPRLYARAGYVTVASVVGTDAGGQSHVLDVWERVLNANVNCGDAMAMQPQH